MTGGGRVGVVPVAAWLANRTSRPHHVYRSLIRAVPVPPQRIRDWLSERELFLVVSTGRTGTKWLSGLLARMADAVVEHEPVPRETWAHREATEHPDAAARYVERFRLKEIYLRARARDPLVYGEVNGALRRHVDALREAVPTLRLVHLIRDGRDVVRSLVSRETWSSEHPVYGGFRPPPVDDLARSWDRRSPFERACWIWQWENAFIRERIPDCARLEDIVSSYAAFEEQVLTPLGLALDESTWREARNSVVNRTPRHGLPHWEDWPAERKATFQRICGDEMARYGYRSF